MVFIILCSCVDKIMDFIFYDWSANLKFIILIPIQLGIIQTNKNIFITGKVICKSSGYRTFKFVCSILSHRIHHTTHRFSVFCIECTSNDLEVLNDFRFNFNSRISTAKYFIHLDTINKICNFIISPTAKMTFNNTGLHCNHCTNILDS